MKLLQRFTRPAAVAVLSAGLLFQTGCLLVAAGAAGAGTVAYVRGELEASLEAGYDKTTRASVRAIEQLQFIKISESKDALTDTLIARTADDKKIEIKVSKVSDNLSRVQIRVGVFGDEAVSMAILDKIKAGL